MAQKSLEILIEMKQQSWKSSVNALCVVKHYYTFANKPHIYCEALVSCVSTYTIKHMDKKRKKGQLLRMLVTARSRMCNCQLVYGQCVNNRFYCAYSALPLYSFLGFLQHFFKDETSPAWCWVNQLQPEQLGRTKIVFQICLLSVFERLVQGAIQVRETLGGFGECF